jgi:hypothetical protein
MSDFARPIDITAQGRVSYGLDSGLMVEFYIKPRLLERVSQVRGMPTYEDRIYTRIISPGNTKTTWDYETKGLRYLYEDLEQTEDRENSVVLEWGRVVGYEIDETVNEEQCEPVRFPNAWKRFEKKGEKVKSGFPIEEWGAIPRSFAESLKSQNVHTLEALAGLSDAAASNLMGGIKWRNLAKAELDKQKERELLSAEQEARSKAEADNKDLRDQLKALQTQIDALTKKKSA